MSLKGQVNIVALGTSIIDRKSLWIDMTLFTLGPLDLA